MSRDIRNKHVRIVYEAVINVSDTGSRGHTNQNNIAAPVILIDRSKRYYNNLQLSLAVWQASVELQ